MADTLTVQFEGTGPGILPSETVNEFSCNFNRINNPRNCKFLLEAIIGDSTLREVLYMQILVQNIVLYTIKIIVQLLTSLMCMFCMSVC